MTAPKQTIAGPTIARQYIDEARRQLAAVRQRLLHPEWEELESALPELETAVVFLRQGEALLVSGASATDPAWESARQLRRELAQVNALVRQANEFLAVRIRLLAGQDFSLCYDAHGTASAPPKLVQSGLGPSEKGAVLRG